jgi:hypothetical protein
VEPTSDKHYEDEFEFPLWKLVRQVAEEKDISYFEAARKVLPKYVKTIKYRCKEFEEAVIRKRMEEVHMLEQKFKRKIR